MKREISKIMGYILVVVSISMIFVSCKKDPVEPVDETKHKDHDNPAKAELLLIQGHLHGKHGFHQNPQISGMKHLKIVQKITYSYKDGEGWGPTAESAKMFKVVSTEKAKQATDGAAVYGLIINYFDADGDTITQEFVENGQDKIHQHFFIPKNIETSYGAVNQVKDNNPENLFDYVYCDTDPWNQTLHDKHAELIGDKNPIGMKGYFWFKKVRKKFDLQIRLMHAAQSKFNEDGKASPFDKPSNAQLQIDHWDLIMKVPVIVYADSYEYLDGEYDLNKSEKELEKQLDSNADDKKYVRSIMEAYSIGVKEALKDIILILEGDVDPESGQIYF